MLAAFHTSADLWIFLLNLVLNSVLCAAKPGGYGTCFGDSGVPTTIDNVVVGISSVFQECGTDTYPGAFTRVDIFTNWIMEVATYVGGYGTQ